MANRKKYTSVKKMQETIDQYFEDCEGDLLVNGDGDPVLDKYGHPVRDGARPPTVTGLALALGFATRQSLLDYQADGAFHDIITLAKTRCEAYAEARLYDRDGVNGARFSLINNFKGWRDKPADETDAAALEKLDRIIEGISHAAQS